MLIINANRTTTDSNGKQFGHRKRQTAPTAGRPQWQHLKSFQKVYSLPLFNLVISY